MRDDVKITERDIFDFIFLKKKLSQKKIKEITTNIYFQDKIRFYEKLKENLNKGLNKEVKAKIATNILSYKASKPNINYKPNKLQIK